MLLNRLKELKKEKGLTSKQIAEKTNLPERTIKRIFSGETPNPYLDTIHSIVTVLGCSLNELFADSKLVVGNEDLATLQEKLDIATAELDLVKAENTILKDNHAAFTAESELLKLEIKHKDEIIAIHNYYTKIKTE